MKSENARSLSELADLTRRARDVDFREVDASNAVFLAALGHINALESAGAMTAHAADEQQRDLIGKRRELLEQMIAAGPAWHYRQFAPAPAPTDREVARAALDLADREGVRLFADHTGAVEASPSQHGLSTHLREMLVEYRAHIVAELRAGIIRIEPPAPAHRRGGAV